MIDIHTARLLVADNFAGADGQLRRQVEMAVELYNARRELGHSEGSALYSVSAGLARAAYLTREAARCILAAAIAARSGKPTPESI